ncbi:protein-glutamate O-methyltransferase CheR [Pullulanibacillus sp. KACC 23026]|uniref:CheR family methyltransferase n=1 Tax=Pullulanibacillus sp. KACC 23026 TaxID=3028315 RepID=UPI0023AFD05E|nr:protein-glutamate O-methyltransferase CheR [Pullulanibacillus sp. KACC 23026]WEG11269.1 protein-glutamate O-methyltransferase CheR [Pullulanibacillus sp. KACC 23026]
MNCKMQLTKYRFSFNFDHEDGKFEEIYHFLLNFLSLDLKIGAYYTNKGKEVMGVRDEGLEKLSDMIYDYCGLVFIDRLDTLRDKLGKRLIELELTAWEYGDFLMHNSPEWDVLVELLTINESYFYREENQLNECCSIVLPQLKEINKYRPIRIWSAACSTGEEPYTLSMLIHESGQILPGNVEIMATDINKKVLEKAKKGWYKDGSLAFRRIPKHLLENYFTEEEGGYQIKPYIQKMVTFRHLNLLDDKKIDEEIGKVDIILCRNVLIYFDQLMINKVIESLYRVLTPGGFLFLGHAESIKDSGLGLKKVNTHRTFYYRKETTQHEEVQNTRS